MRFLYRPMLAEQPFHFTHDFIAKVGEVLVLRNRNKFKMTLPPEWLFAQRLRVGMFSVLAHLGGSGYFGEIFRETLALEPTPIYRSAAAEGEAAP